MPGRTSAIAFRFAVALAAVSPLVVSARPFEPQIPTATARATSPKSVAELLSAHDRQLAKDLLTYIETAPKAVDIDQAYMALFNKVIEYDWFAEFEPAAAGYLQRFPDGPVRSLAEIVVTMAKAHAGDFNGALKHYNDLMAGLGKPEQEEFAANFADSLANVSTSAGKFDVSRKVFGILLSKYSNNPDLRKKIGDDLDTLDKVGKPAPEVVANDVKGDPFRLANVKGKYVLIDFWASWCAPWVADLSTLEAIYAKYRPRGFEIVGVNLDESKDAVLDFTSTRKVPWRQIHNATCGGDVVEAYGVGTIPATFLIDPNGTLIRLELRGKTLDQVLESLLPATPGSERSKRAAP